MTIPGFCQKEKTEFQDGSILERLIGHQILATYLVDKHFLEKLILLASDLPRTLLSLRIFNAIGLSPRSNVVLA